MGQGISVDCNIEILAPPAVVRSVFLDFSRYHEWHQGWKVTRAEPDKGGDNLEIGDVLKVKMHGLAFSPAVVENSPHRFTWAGHYPGILTGTHHFEFLPSETNPGSTTFVQREDFTGPLPSAASAFGVGKSDKHKTSENWNNFNNALKAEAERLAAAAQSTSTPPPASTL